MTERAQSAGGDAAPTIAPPPTIGDIREVRFAVVLYGGVSLAIYMNGIVQELLQLVRSTAPEPDGNSGRLWWGDEDLLGAASVYRKLGCLLVDGGLQLAGVSIDENTTPTPT